MHGDTQPWYKQFWPWFLIVLPGSVVIAAFVTLAIAIQHSDEIVRDDYYKDGLAINQQLERDKVAQTMQLQANLQLTTATGELRLWLPPEITDNNLTLHWMHPLKKQFDRIIVLTRHSSDGSYAGQTDTNVSGRFYLELENTTPDTTSAWRLRGEMTIDDAAPQTSLTMIP